ncbi:hypothetical protein BCR44DRAFT_332458 [Catenaria anguillulae PL171]|uniref:Uncharacterized protein n=1 Tax=Catenaria anguillulae PL171 TaxID=765915 RepID=A0A1Y2HQ19_9FUNG|nr:hypothetical protein BCR44DRAFT_332458 [Catenaria anguillulae PL171]
MSRPLSWSDVKFTLQDYKNEPVAINQVLPYPNSFASDSSPADQPAVQGLCTLAPTGLAHRLPPSLVEPDDGCAYASRIGPRRPSCMQNGTASPAWLDAQCVWNALVEDPNDMDLPVSRLYCLPLDDPTILSNRPGGLVPVPILNDTLIAQVPSTVAGHPQHNYRLVPALKHHLESRNHSAANSLVFANITVRPMHKRLRLGVCVPLPPIGSPCMLSAIDNSTGTIASDWIFPGGRFWPSSEIALADVALARTHASLSSMVGPAVNTVDQAAMTPAFPPPYPFFRYPIPHVTRDGPRLRGPFKAWAIPLIRCAPRDNSSTSGPLGTVQRLIINGTCAMNRDCLSGVCSPATKSCDNSIKSETNSPFSPAFTFLVTPPSAVEYPASNLAARQVLDQYSPGYPYQDLPGWYTYYFPLILALGIVLAGMLMTGIWTGCLRRVVRRWTGQWRTTTERDVELKPVSGRMVGDLGDEAAVEEAVAEAREQLPVYVQPS